MSTDQPLPAWAEALGRIPSGLFILTVRHGEQETGMLASWVMQAGFEPPSVTVAVRRDRYLAEWLSAGSPFVLNAVPDHAKTLMKHFVRGFEPDQPAFEGLNITRSGRNVAILTDGLAHLECTPQSHIDSGDHRIFLATVTGGGVTHAADPFVHIRKNGLRY